jgi:hypothetical protein
MYISRNKRQQIFSSVGRFLEPFGLGLLCLLFIIPALTFSNLTPLAKKLNDNVLGVQDETGFEIEMVGGNHNVFQNEHLVKQEDNLYKYDTKIISHSTGNYSKPILLITNLSSSTNEITFKGRTEIPIGSKIGLIYEDRFHELQDSLGETTTQKISIEGLDTINVFLSVESFGDVQFGETFFMDISF